MIELVATQGYEIVVNSVFWRESFATSAQNVLETLSCVIFSDSCHFPTQAAYGVVKDSLQNTELTTISLPRVANNSFTEVVEPSTRGAYTRVKDFAPIVQP